MGSWNLAKGWTVSAAFDDAPPAISTNPQAGHSREDAPPAHRAYLVGSHVIVYRIGADSVGVVRILHLRMSLARSV